MRHYPIFHATLSPVAVPLFERIPYDIMLLSYDSYDSQRPIEGLEKLWLRFGDTYPQPRALVLIDSS